MENKEVYFNLNCPTCKYRNLKEAEDPCHDCLNVCFREDTHTPLHYEKGTDVVDPTPNCIRKLAKHNGDDGKIIKW